MLQNKGAYTFFDFTESVTHRDVGLKLEDVDLVLWAWGEGGDYSEWSGGFIIRMKNGDIWRIEGSCDTTGWGCQDGASKEKLDVIPYVQGADELPLDINSMLKKTQRGESHSYDPY